MNKKALFSIISLFLINYGISGCSSGNRQSVSTWLASHSNEQILYDHVILDAKIKQ